MVGDISFDYKRENDKQKLKVEINNVAIAQGSNIMAIIGGLG